ncbi:aldose 1-epimerase [Embleya sp. NBC_00896]|uniref:aldose epimerase family protein n=1 Tax=Embleya sp. NBC_00896 TaxID=2975961 RepID=UPI003866976C|nr:aldose 1-epimerase [Embleya sp. NBC_00896]
MIDGEVWLRSEGAEALILPAAGCRLGSLRAHGLELLRTGGEHPAEWGSYPMAPWVGRMGGARFEFDGSVHEFPADAPPHALHGLGYRAGWKHMGGDAESAVFELVLDHPWPFAGRIEQTFTVLPDGLVTTLRIESDEATFPAQAGWHPWFRRDLGVGGPLRLSFEPAWQEERGADYLPTGRRIPPVPGPRDDCYGTPGGLDATLEWPGALRLRMTSDCDYTVVYDLPADHVCVEPETGPPNGLVGPTAHLVRPGDPLTATTTWTWKDTR